MKTVGLIGGIGPESTIEYYRLIIAGYRDQQADGSQPSIIINSVDVNRLIGWITANELNAFTDYLVNEVQKLAGASVGSGKSIGACPARIFGSLRESIPTRRSSTRRMT